MMIRIFLVIGFLFGSLNLCAQSAWKPDYYARYNHDNFDNFVPFSKIIDPGKFDQALLNAAIFFETNRQRKLQGLHAFQYNKKLENSAQGHSADMVSKNFLAHNSPTAGKQTLNDRLSRVGYQWLVNGENLADHPILNHPPGEGYYAPSQFGYFADKDGARLSMHSYLSLALVLVKEWMDSPSHRENVLFEQFTQLGVGCSIHAKGKGIDRVYYVKCTQNFGAERKE